MARKLLTAQAIDAGTFDTSRYEPRDSYGRPYEVEKGGWITLLVLALDPNPLAHQTFSPFPARQGDTKGEMIAEARTIQVSRERAHQAMAALAVGKRIV